MRIYINSIIYWIMRWDELSDLTTTTKFNVNVNGPTEKRGQHSIYFSLIYSNWERKREREGEKIVIRSKTLNIKQIYCKERIKYKMRKKNSKKYI